MEVDTVVLNDAVDGNDTISQQMLANITWFKCSKKSHYRTDYPNSAGTSPVPYQTASLLTYSQSSMVKQVVMAYYAVC